MPTQSERIQSLQSTVLFHELSYEAVVQALDKFSEQQFAAGTIIFDANTSGDNGKAYYPVNPTRAM